MKTHIFTITKRKNLGRVSLGVLLGMGLGLGASQSTQAGFYISYTVPNTVKDANDLEFTFDQAPQGGTSHVFADNDRTGNTITFSGATITNPGLNNFKKGTTDFGSITFGKGVDVNKVTLKSAALSFDTGANVPLVPLPNVAVAKMVSFLPGGTETMVASLFNADTVPVFFSGLSLAVDVPSSYFNDDSASLTALSENNLYISSGTAVLPPLSSFELMPGQEMDLNLGPVDGVDYAALNFQVDYSAPTSGSPQFGFAFEEAVPEPSSYALFAAGGFGLLALHRSRRARA